VKIIILKSNPNEKGALNTLVCSFIKGAEEIGNKVYIINLANLNFSLKEICLRIWLILKK